MATRMLAGTARILNLEIIQLLDEVCSVSRLQGLDQGNGASQVIPLQGSTQLRQDVIQDECIHGNTSGNRHPRRHGERR